MSLGTGRTSAKIRTSLEPKRTLKPILPKLPFGKTSSEYDLLHGGEFVGKGICYVCDTRLYRGVRLVSRNSPAPQSVLATRIGQLMGDSFMVVVTEEDVLCQKCHALLIHVGKLEKELKQVKQLLRGHMVCKYKISDAVFNDCRSPPPDGRERSGSCSEGRVRLKSSLKGEMATSKTPKESQQGGKQRQTTQQCTMCDMQFDSIRAVRKHKMSVHLTTWTCHFCNKVFDEENTFTEHTKTHLSEPTTQSAAISSVFDSNEFTDDKALLAQPVTHEPQETEVAEMNSTTANQVFFNCAMCEVDFVQEDVYTEHMQTHEALSSLDLASLGKSEGLSLDGFEANPESVDLMDINMFDNTDSTLDRLNRFICTDCETEYETGEELNEHIQSEHEMKQCSACPEIVGTKDQVDAHVLEVHGNQEIMETPPLSNTGDEEVQLRQQFTCELCDSVIFGEEEFGLHIEECGNKMDRLTCGKCAAIADSEEVLAAHVEICGIELVDNENVKVEMFNGADEEALQLNGDMLENMDSVDDVAMPKKPRTISCSACGETFCSKPLLLEHERSNPDHLVIECPDCDLRFPRERFLHEHRDEVHETMHCRHCKKVFTNLKQLKAHENRHARAQRSSYQCVTCGKQFQTPTGLRHHMAVHTGDYKYKCEFCDKGFVSRVRSEEHRACHTKEKRYSCEVCGRKFSVQATYWIHRKWHENPKPYKCQECGMLFKHTSLLAVHKRKHTGERPYMCQYCDQTFIVSNSLKRHMTLHTGSFPYSCSICNVGFPAKHKMAQHMSKVHNDHQLLMEQLNKKSRDLVMAVKDPKDEDAVKEQLSETWVLAEGSHEPGQYLTLQTEEGQRILLTEGMLQERGDNQLVEIVLEGDQQDLQVPYQVQGESSEYQHMELGQEIESP